MVDSGVLMYVEPIGSYTNAVVAEMLPPENSSKDIECHGGRHDLWLCSTDFIKKIEEDTKTNSGLRFNLWHFNPAKQRIELFESDDNRTSRIKLEIGKLGLVTADKLLPQADKKGVRLKAEACAV